MNFVTAVRFWDFAAKLKRTEGDQDMREFRQEDLRTLALELPDEILKYKQCGDLKGAREAVSRWMERPVAEDLKKRMELELMILDEYPSQFPYTGDEVVRMMADLLPGFDRSDLDRIDRDGRAEWVILDGEKHYIHNIIRNITGNDNEIIARIRENGTDEAKKKIPQESLTEILTRANAEIMENGGSKWRFHMRTSIRLKDELFRPGMKLKVHLPIPAEHHQTSEVKILSHADGCVTIDPPDSLYRSICFEDTPEENREFFVEYEYTVSSVYHDYSPEDEARSRKLRGEEKISGGEAKGDSSVIPDRIVPGTEQWELYTKEQYPHIRFSLYLTALAKEIVGDEKRPLEIARKIYDYITRNVKYSLVREYFLIPDIPQYCARNLRGDCGVQALLFITLCRICGVPAKWQSGLNARPKPGKVGPHDWAMFYAEPYGWLFADPSFGGSAFDDGDEPRRKYYFGNLDSFRMVANNAFQQAFADAKKYRPIDPYDNQTGELESEERGFGSADLITEQEMLSAEKIS